MYIFNNSFSGKLRRERLAKKIKFLMPFFLTGLAMPFIWFFIVALLVASE